MHLRALPIRVSPSTSPGARRSRKRLLEFPRTTVIGNQRLSPRLQLWSTGCRCLAGACACSSVSRNWRALPAIPASDTWAAQLLLIIAAALLDKAADTVDVWKLAYFEADCPAAEQLEMAIRNNAEFRQKPTEGGM
jgi:hypothetical protein